MAKLAGKRIVMAGGSGFIGLSMAKQFAEVGADVTIISRSTPKAIGSWKHRQWDGRTLGGWVEVIDGSDAIVNLAGRTVNCIKTPDIARAWEAAFADNKLPQQRGVVMRTSFVVGHDRGAGGGAIGTLGLIAKLGLGGKVASGTQGMSWIHEDDINAIFARAIVDGTMAGTYIVSSPNPISQVAFMRTLRKVLGVTIGLPAFEWMVRIGAPMVFRTDPDLALYGRYVIPKRLLDEGFKFRFTDLECALRDLYVR
jgi:NAD dependent epimerase/dehydratase family enzyme